MTTNRATGPKSRLQTASQAVGAVFLLVGILGFIPGNTSNYALGFAGHGSGALLRGIFQVSVLHNIVHLLFGAAGILMWAAEDGSFPDCAFADSVTLRGRLLAKSQAAGPWPY